MEKMPFSETLHAVLPAMEYPAAHESTSTDWRRQLPVLSAGSVTLRALRQDDAASLFELLTTEEVARFISPPPTSVEGFEKFIAWATREQQAGRYACFAVVPAGTGFPCPPKLVSEMGDWPMTKLTPAGPANVLPVTRTLLM